MITSIIVDDLERGRFFIKNFYERRIRRIIPALYTVCAVSFVIAVLIFLPDELDAFGKSLIATLLFVSNILFWSEAGYFDAAASLKPLLHTWSLAVEEQFYIFFPLLLLAVSRFLNERYLPVLLSILVASFAISIWGVEHKPSATFYWAPTRAWELLLGSLLAPGLLPRLKQKYLNEIAGVFGLSMIGYSVFSFDYDTAFPGFGAVPPCLGAALLLYANGKATTLSGRFLSLKPLVFIGLCSYSFYLWHWPILVFAGYLSIAPLDGLQSSGLVALSFVLAVLTWKFIETPFRNRAFLPGKWKIFLTALAASIPLFAGAAYLVISHGAPQRFSDIEVLASQKGGHEDPACVDIAPDAFAEKHCVFGDKSQKPPSFIVWGDSHAGAFISGFDSAGKERKEAGILASSSGCPPLLGIRLARDENAEKCTDFHKAVLSSLRPGETVFLVARWTYYTRRSLISHEGPTWLNDDKSDEISEKENYRVFAAALARTVAAIKERGAVPVIVGSVPEYPRSVPDMIFLFKRNCSPPPPAAQQRANRTERLTP